jgi:hypothetical protein
MSAFWSQALAGYLAGLPFGTAAVIGAAIAVVIAPIATVCVTEPTQGEVQKSEPDNFFAICGWG